MTVGERAADWTAAHLGSWTFVLAQTLLIAVWMGTNAGGLDPFPWMFLNLALSLQAAYTGPVLLISQNRADTMRTQLLEAVDNHTDTLATHSAETTAAIQEMRRDFDVIMRHLRLIEDARP